MDILSLLLAIPLIGAVVTAMSGRVSPLAPRVTALFFMLLDFAVGVTLMFNLSDVADGTIAVRHPWLPSFGVHYSLVCDGLSGIMVLLTTVIGIIAVLISWKEITEKIAAFHVWVLLLQVGILLVFLARDMMLFYFGWELMLVPMFFIVGVWGHEQKLYAALKFFLFTFTGSIFMLIALLYVYYQHAQQTGAYSFEFSDLLATTLSAREQWWVFLGLFVGFAVKVPLFPFHTWLPDAHTQAPTAGSLILAGLLLKTGVYGLLRFAIPLLPLGSVEFAPLVMALAVFGIFYGAICAFTQSDYKRLVAYSSISHLGFVILGLFVQNAAGVQGCVLQMVNHALATGALFLIGGMIQDRAHTRHFDMFGGLWRQVPVMGGFLLFFALASLGLPGTGNFVGELFVVGGTSSRNWWLGSLTVFGILFAAAYSLRVFIATMQGPESRVLKRLPDTNLRENLCLGILAVSLVVIGFYPSLITKPLYWNRSERKLLELSKAEPLSSVSRDRSPSELVIPINGRKAETAVDRDARDLPPKRRLREHSLAPVEPAQSALKLAQATNSPAVAEVR